MKLSKALLSAMLAGVATQAVTTAGCTSKSKSDIKPQTETSPQNQNVENPSVTPDSSAVPDQGSCPACGMG